MNRSLLLLLLLLPLLLLAAWLAGWLADWLTGATLLLLLRPLLYGVWHGCIAFFKSHPTSSAAAALKHLLCHGQFAPSGRLQSIDATQQLPPKLCVIKPMGRA